MTNTFFKKNNVKINDILKCLKLKKLSKNIIVNDIHDLIDANINDISFFHSKKYLESVKSTKAKIIITNSKLKNMLPKNLHIVEVQNVLLSVAKVTSLFYPKALDDIFDNQVSSINKKKIY